MGHPMKSKRVDEKLYDKIEEELLAGERVLWIGQPGKARFFWYGADSRLLSMIIGITLAAILIGGGLLITSRPDISVVIWIFGIFLLTSLASILGPLFATHHLIYAITNRRAMIVQRKNVRSFGEKDLEFIERRMGRHGHGDIIFKYDNRVGYGYYGASTTNQVAVGFIGIENAREVEALMLETFRAGQAPAHRAEAVIDEDEIGEWEMDDAPHQRLYDQS